MLLLGDNYLYCSNRTLSDSLGDGGGGRSAITICIEEIESSLLSLGNDGDSDGDGDGDGGKWSSPTLLLSLHFGIVHSRSFADCWKMEKEGVFWSFQEQNDRR